MVSGSETDAGAIGNCDLIIYGQTDLKRLGMVVAVEFSRNEKILRSQRQKSSAAACRELKLKTI